MKKTIFILFVFISLSYLHSQIYVYPKNNEISSLSLKLSNGENFTEKFLTPILFYGYKQNGEKIHPVKYDNSKLVSIDNYQINKDISIRSIKFDIELSEVENYGKEFYKLDIEEGDQINCSIISEGNQYPALLNIKSISPENFAIKTDIKLKTLDEIVKMLSNNFSEEEKGWNRANNKITSNYFETITTKNLPEDNFIKLKVQGNTSDLKFQAINQKGTNRINIDYKSHGNNIYSIPRLKYHSLQCWANNTKKNLKEVFTTKEYIESEIDFEFNYNNKTYKYTKNKGDKNIYVPYPHKKINNALCEVDNNSKNAVILNEEDNTISIKPVTMLLLDLNSTKTTNKKNIYEYLNFAKDLVKNSKNTQVKVFKLFYLYPQPGMFKKYNVDKIYTKFTSSEYSIVNSSNSSEFISWREKNESSSIEASEIPQNYFACEIIETPSYFDDGLPTTNVKENMANKSYVESAGNVVDRIGRVEDYDFSNVYYISYFPVLEIYKSSQINYISFVKDKENFNISKLK